MAKGNLNPESKKSFAEKIASGAKEKAKAKAEKLGIDTSNIKANARSWEEIKSAIDTAKADPKFMKKMEGLKQSQESSKPAPKPETTTKTPIITSTGTVIKTPVGTQTGHVVTSVDRKTGKANK